MNIKELMDKRGFSIPTHSNKCKICYGTGRIGYNYDPKNIQHDENGKRIKGEPIPCPKYRDEMTRSLKKFIDSITPEEKAMMKIGDIDEIHGERGDDSGQGEEQIHESGFDKSGESLVSSDELL